VNHGGFTEYQFSRPFTVAIAHALPVFSQEFRQSRLGYGEM
jgi:hypothetical protein